MQALPIEPLLSPARPERLLGHILGVLGNPCREEGLFPRGLSRDRAASAVLLLLCPHPERQGAPSLLLNKRSLRVKQPGDLCFPGGRVSHPLDVFLARVLRLPFLPLGRWPYWRVWQALRGHEGKGLSLLLAAGVREAVEEMRMNPFGVRFLGPMPSQSLLMFRRVIYPMVGWLGSQRRFFPNWEVERIVFIPLAEFLDPRRYGLYRLHAGAGQWSGASRDFPCFRYEDALGEEILWGATYRIVGTFLETVFGFAPPGGGHLPVVEGTLPEGYWKGSV